MPPPERPTGLSRRTLIGGVGLGAAGGLVSGFAWGEGRGPGSNNDQAQRSRVPHAEGTVSAWTGDRGKRYFIAHRGSGDVLPEHSMEAYKAAAAWGAPCMEISVGMMSDGTLICHHDLTFDRTTSLRGEVTSWPSTALRRAHLVAPQLGPAWAEQPLPRIPLFEDVLRAFGGRVILCVEAKVDAAFPSMMSAVERFGLADSVIVKGYFKSSRLREAKKSGYPVFAYFGSAGEVDASAVDRLARRLDPRTDALVLPAHDGDHFLADAVVARAVRSEVPVWVYAIHRRSEAAHYLSRGVQGIITSSLGYVSSGRAVTTRDTWATGAVASGEMTKDPTSAVWAPTWNPDGSVTLGLQGRQHFLTLGQFSPVARAKGDYTVQFDAAFTEAPGDPTSNLSLAFGHDDDRYYEHQLGASTGYHAILRYDGRLELFEHLLGEPAGVALGLAHTAAVNLGTWMTFRLRVSPTTLVWERLDEVSPPVIVRHAEHRGGYLHVGRSATNGALSLRHFSVD